MKIIITENQLNILEKYINNSTSITEQVFLKKLLNLGLHGLDDDVVKLGKTLSDKLGGSGDDILKTFANTLSLLTKSKTGNYKFGTLIVTPKKLDEILVGMADPNKVDALLKILDNYKIDSSGTKSLADVLRETNPFLKSGTTPPVTPKTSSTTPKTSSTTVSPSLTPLTKEELKKTLSNDIEKIFNSRAEDYNDPSVLYDLKDDMFRKFESSKIYEKLLNGNVQLSEIISEVNREVDKLASSKSLELLKPEDKDSVKAFLKATKEYLFSYQKEQFFWSKKYKIVNGKKIISLPKTGFNILATTIGILALTEALNRLGGGDFKPISWMINNLMKSFGMDNTKENLLDFLKNEDSSIYVGDKSVSIYGNDAPENLYLKDLDEKGLTYTSKDKILTINSGIQLNGTLFKSFKWDGDRKKLSVILPQPTIEDFTKWFTTNDTDYINSPPETKKQIKYEIVKDKDNQLFKWYIPETETTDTVFGLYIWDGSKFSKKS